MTPIQLFLDGDGELHFFSSHPMQILHGQGSKVLTLCYMES